MPQPSYEFRVSGRLSETARSAFAGMDVREVPAGTVVVTTVSDDADVHAVLELIQSLGLRVTGFRRLPRAGARGS